MKSVALSTREIAHFLLLIGTLEVELRQIRARLHLAFADHDDVVPFAHFLVDGICVIQLARLIDVRELHRITNRERATVGLLPPDDHPEQRGLAGAIWPDDADDSATRQREREIVEQHFVAVSFLEPLRDHYIIAEARWRRNDDLVLHDFLAFRRARQLLVLLNARLALCLTRPRRHSHPLQLALESTLSS